MSHRAAAADLRRCAGMKGSLPAPELHAAAAIATRRVHATEWQRAAANGAELIARVQRWR